MYSSLVLLIPAIFFFVSLIKISYDIFVKSPASGEISFWNPPTPLPALYRFYKYIQLFLHLTNTHSAYIHFWWYLAIWQKPLILLFNTDTGNLYEYLCTTMHVDKDLIKVAKGTLHDDFSRNETKKYERIHNVQNKGRKGAEGVRWKKVLGKLSRPKPLTEKFSHRTFKFP